MAAIAGTGTGAGPAAPLSAAEAGAILAKGRSFPLLPAPSRDAVRGARHCGRGGGGDGGRGGDGRPVPAPHGRAAAVGSAAGLDGRRPPRVGTGAGEAEGREPVGLGRGAVSRRRESRPSRPWREAGCPAVPASDPSAGGCGAAYIVGQRFPLEFLFRLTLNLFHKNLVKVEPLHQLKFLHTTLSQRGLEEFFDDPRNWGEKTVKSGDAWNIKQLRGKSSEDLHKLWYVLLKEKNMLLTLEQESKRQLRPMPSPERLEKVEKSMKNIDLVVREREIALRLLQTGHEKPAPGEWRHDFLGRTYWYTYKEWPIPWYLNKKHKKKKFYYLPHVNHFIRLRLEKSLRRRARRQNLERTRRKVLERKFPHLAIKSQSQ